MICLARKTPKDGKEENIRVRVTPEQKQRLVEYAERHYQSMSGLYVRHWISCTQEKNNKITKSRMELFWSLSLHERYGKYKFSNKSSIVKRLIICLACYETQSAKEFE